MRHGCLVVVVMLLAACSVPAQRTGDVNVQFEREFGDSFLAQYWQWNTEQAIAVGYYGVADRLAVPDAHWRAAYAQFLDRWAARLHRWQPTILDAAHRSDWVLLDNQLRQERWALTELREWEWNPAQYNVAEPFALLLTTDYAPLEQRLRSVLARLQYVPAYYTAARQAVRAPSHEHTQLAIEQNRGALETFGASLEQQVADSQLLPAEQQLFRTRLTAARAAIRGYIDWLMQLQAARPLSPARSFRLGRALYERKFEFTHQSGESPASLYARALQEKQTVLARMEQLSDELWRRYFPGVERPVDRFEKIGRVIERLSDDHVERGGYQPAIERLIPDLTQWVVQHDLIDIDQSKPLTVRPTPPYERGIAIAGIEAPGPYDPGARTYFNVDPLVDETPQQTESFLREYNNWMLPIFIVHEAIPGHYVQLMYANRTPSRIKSIFGNGATIEGWAVYCERMMLESGYGNAPERWLMYWKWYLRSVTNTILDYQVHVLDMSAEQAQRLLVREAFQSEREAANKWQRVQLTSVQLTQYFAGFSAIYGLRERLRQEQGDSFDLKRFHEGLLQYGSAPVRMIDELMSDELRPATR